MKCLLFFFILLLILQLSNSTMLITQPAVTNFPKNQVQYWYANFGTIHYNKPLSVDIFYTNETLCDPASTALKPFTTPTFIIVKQGFCSYPIRAIQAQNLGALGIIFGSSETDYAEGNVIISDDGNGRKVTITALFIKIKDVDKLAELKNAKIKVNFELKQTDSIKVNLFLSGSGRQNYVFLRNFRPYYNNLKQKISINLSYHTIECKSCSEQQCVLQKNFCNFDLDYYGSDKGKYIVYEQLRQYKIFKYFENEKTIDKWFQYMDRFDKKCDNDWINSEACSLQIQKDLGIGKLSNVNQFDTMMEWRRLQIKTGIISLPDLSVNGIRHVELLTADSALDMICESFKTKPNQCLADKDNEKGNKDAIIAVAIISAIIFIIGGIFCYRKIIRRQITNDMSSKVDELVSKYAAKVSEQRKKRKDRLMQRMNEQL